MVVFVCEDSPEGIFTGVYDAWSSRLGHENVRLEVQGEYNYSLFSEYREVAVDQLKAQNAALTAQLQDRQLRLEKAGSIAQAALELNNVFAAAQAAADDYLHSVQANLADTDAAAANTLSQARSEAKRILEQAQADADSLKAQTRQECSAMVEQAEQEVQQRWQTFDRKANALLDQYRSADSQPSEET